MKISLKSWIVVLFSALCLLSTAMGVCVFGNVSATTGAFQMKGGASIRPVGNADEYGICFAATDANFSSEINYQMMIIPTEYVEQYDKDVTENKDNIVAWLIAKKQAYESNNEGKTFPLAIVEQCLYDEVKGEIYGSIVDVKYENLNRNFYAYVYYLDGENYVVAEKCSVVGDECRSIAQVATNALLSGDYATDASTTENLQTIVVNAIKQSQGLEKADDVSISLNVSEVTKLRGETAQLTYDGVGKDLIKYTSLDEKICIVDESGLITFVGVGETTVTAEVCGLVASVKVTSTVPATEVLSFDVESDINNIKAMGGSDASTEYLEEFEGEKGVAKLTYSNGWPFMHFKPIQKMANYADFDVIIFRMYFPKTEVPQYIKYWKLGNNNGGTNIFANNANGNFLGDQLNTWINLVFDAETFRTLWTDDIDLSSASGNSSRLWGESTGGNSGTYYVADISMKKYEDTEVLSFDHQMDLDNVANMTAEATKTWLKEFEGEKGVMKMEYTSAWPQFTFTPNQDKSIYANATKIFFRVYVSDEGVHPIKSLVLIDKASSNLTATQYNTWIDLEYDITEWKAASGATKFWMYSNNGTSQGNSCIYIANIWVE